jgi:hypothetical protein
LDLKIKTHEILGGMLSNNGVDGGTAACGGGKKSYEARFEVFVSNFEVYT